MTKPESKSPSAKDKKRAAALPALSHSGGLTQYLREIRAFPMLEKEEEFTLARRWRDEQDRDAAHKLVTSHLRLVAKIAMGYRGYGLPISEVISEGNIGLMQAVKRFDPEKGFRLTTYAVWWIRAAIQEYVLRSWSLVKIGTTSAQKKLFFNLAKAKQEIAAYGDGDMKPDQVRAIARRLDVSEQEVVMMNRRLSRGDSSLNAPYGRDEDGGERQDWLPSEEADQEETLMEDQEWRRRRRILAEAMKSLNEREQQILTARRLQETPATLDELAQRFGVSRERVRQIEVRGFEKLQSAIKRARARPFLKAPPG